MAFDHSKLKKLVANDEIKAALKLLEDFSAMHAPRHETEIIMHQAKFNRLNRDNNMGILTPQDYDMNMARLRMAILDLCSTFEKIETAEEVPTKNEAAAKTPIVLIASANSDKNYLENIRREREEIEKALREFDDKNWIKIKKKEQTSSDLLISEFQSYRQQITIFHFSGHANGSSLQLEGEKGEEIAHASGMASWLGDMPQLQLVFLNGCATVGQVETLLLQGVKVVIATATAVEDSKATEFAIWFYTTLAKGETIGQAFRNARNSLEMMYENTKIAETRGLKFKRNMEEDEFLWGIYYDNDAALDWRLPKR